MIRVVASGDSCGALFAVSIAGSRQGSIRGSSRLSGGGTVRCVSGCGHTPEGQKNGKGSAAASGTLRAPHVDTAVMRLHQLRHHPHARPVPVSVLVVKDGSNTWRKVGAQFTEPARSGRTAPLNGFHPIDQENRASRPGPGYRTFTTIVPVSTIAPDEPVTVMV
jgi:hypothetical protein